MILASVILFSFSIGVLCGGWLARRSKPSGEVPWRVADNFGLPVPTQYPPMPKSVEPPVPPPCRIIREGGSSVRCHICHSSMKRSCFGFGKLLGCIQPECWNYYEWKSLPAGVNPPAGLYGGPVKPPAPPAPPR